MIFETCDTGNGNGNKMNLRLEILEGLFHSFGEGSNAKINSLKQTITANKTNMADSAAKSLDLMRQVFQSGITNELREILDRHIRTTFSPALENLKRNGHNVSEEDIKELCRNMLEAAKLPFISVKASQDSRKLDSNSFDSDLESELSAVSSINAQSCSTNSFTMRRRGRPKKLTNEVLSSDIPILLPGQEIMPEEIAKWRSERINATTRFIIVSKVSRILTLSNRRSLFLSFPLIYRYEVDESDRNWLVENRLTTRLSGKMFIMILDDAFDVAASVQYSGSRAEFQRFSFCVTNAIMKKMHAKMKKFLEKMKKMHHF